MGKILPFLFLETARSSIGSNMPAKSLELKHTIKLISEFDAEIDEIEKEIKSIMDQINSPILSIPGISYRMGAMIIAEIGNFSRFDSPDKIFAYAGLSPSTYQSGQLESSYSHMKKEVRDICDMPYSVPPNLFAIGMNLLAHTLPKSKQKASTTMSLYPMLQKNS